MKKPSEFQEAKELLNILRPVADSYYNNDESLISDAEYDTKKDRLITIYEKVLLLKKSIDKDFIKEVETFLNQIGAQVSASEWKKATHRTPMTSLNKVNTQEEFLSWTREINDKSYLIFDKMDGGSIDLFYKNGYLKEAITRGNGLEGELITQNVLKMQNVKPMIPGFTGNLKGEIFIRRNDFDTLNNSSKKTYKNPRNTVGLCKALDGVNVNFLSIFFYDIEDDNEQFETEEQKLLKIQSLDLKTCFYKKVTVEQAISIFNQYEFTTRTSLDYDIDGLVIRANSTQLQEQHGMLGNNPKAKIAWKFKPMQKETILRNIVWHISNRRITPIAILDPTPMGGVTVKRCTLHNVDRFKDYNLTKNCKVLIERANDVIPYFIKTLSIESESFEIPSICPECGGDTKIEGAYLICTNSECSGLGTGNLKKWIGELDVKDIGEKLIQMLYEKELVAEPADFYKLSINDIACLDRMGERSATTVINNLKAKMQVTLPEFIAGLNIANFGKSTAKSLMESGFDTIIKIYNAREQDLVQVKGIESKTAEKIVKGIYAKTNVIKNLFNAGITIKQVEQAKLDSNKLSSLSFCFTGPIQSCKPDGKRFTRDDMHALAISNGGKIEESVKKGLSYLVVAPDFTSGKTKKANELKIPILNETEFFKMINP